MKAILKAVRGSLLVPAIFLAGCADSGDEIAAAYVSPTHYSSMSCSQLGAEAVAVTNRARAAVAAQNKKASNDQTAAAVGAILFWPALFMIKGDGAQAAEVARLKGEREAIEAASRAKNCGITFR